MSPEQAMGKPGSQLDPRSDLYSLGVVLYELLTGSQPFKADTPMGVLLHHMQTIPKPPHELTPGQKIPEPVSALVMKALEKDPADRFPSAEEFQKSIAAAASSQPPVASPPPATVASKTTEVLTPPPAVSPRPRSKRPSARALTVRVPKRINPLLIAAVVGAIAAAGILGWNYLGNTQPPDKSSQTPVTQPESAKPATPDPVDKTSGGQSKPAGTGAPSQGPSEAKRRARSTRQNQIRTLTAQAEEAMKQGDYLTASERYQTALSLNPGNAGLKQLLQKARDARQAECDIIGC